jgi:hypothetical protein
MQKQIFSIMAERERRVNRSSRKRKSVSHRVSAETQPFLLALPI